MMIYDVQIFNLLTTFLPQICKKNLSSAISEWSASKTGPDAPTFLQNFFGPHVFMQSLTALAQPKLSS